MSRDQTSAAAGGAEGGREPEPRKDLEHQSDGDGAAQPGEKTDQGRPHCLYTFPKGGREGRFSPFFPAESDQSSGNGLKCH